MNTSPMIDLKSGHFTHAQTQSRIAAVTVIVPVRNEEPAIAHTLDQLLQQQRDSLKLEILVVDGHSTDKTREIVAQYAAQHQEVRLLDNPKHLSSAARNIAIQESKGGYVVVIDGHCELPTRSYFLDLVDAFERSGADCLGRPQPLDVSNATTLQRAIAAARSSPLGHHPDSFIYTNEEVDCPAGSVAVAYKRSVFEKVGLFDDKFDACEDYELNHRIDEAGLRCRLVPKLTVKYEPRKTLRALFQQLYRYGRGRVRMSRKHRGTINFRTLVPATLVLGAAAGPLLCAALPALWPYYVVVMSIYFGATLAESIRLWHASKNWSLLAWLPVVFWTIHFGSGCGLLREMAATTVRRSS